MQHFLDLSQTDFSKLITSWGQMPFRASQITDWIYQKKIYDPALMSNIPAKLRTLLQEELSFSVGEISNHQCCDDKSTKLLVKTHLGHLIETVIMRYDNRTSCCVSTQIGCRLGCRFCQSGRMGFKGNLTTAEILEQVILTEQFLKPENRRISHVVFMGMGEPLDNYQNSIDAANKLISPEGFALSHRHVTISTAGLSERIENLGKDTRASLSVSLHAANDELRTKLMPINRRSPLAKLKDALKKYQITTRKKITLEYLLIKDINSSIPHAKELVRFLQGLKVKVNLIPYNENAGHNYHPPPDQEIQLFQKHLTQRSIPAPIRYSRGKDVKAACGQLATSQGRLNA